MSIGGTHPLFSFSEQSVRTTESGARNSNAHKRWCEHNSTGLNEGYQEWVLKIWRGGAFVCQNLRFSER